MNSMEKEAKQKPTVGRIAVYVTKTGLYQDGLIQAVDEQNHASIRIFDGGPSVTMKNNVSYSAEKKPETWHFKYA